MVLKYKPNLYANILFNLLNAILSLFTFLSVVPFLRILFTEEKIQTADVESQTSTDYWYSRLANNLDAFVAENGKEHALLYMCIAIVIFGAAQEPRELFRPIQLGNHSNWCGA